MMAPQKLLVWRKKQRGRNGACLSQVDAAKRVSASGAAWSDWEHGRKVPDVESAQEIEKLTGVRTEDWALFAKWKRADREAQAARMIGPTTPTKKVG